MYLIILQNITVPLIRQYNITVPVIRLHSFKLQLLRLQNIIVHPEMQQRITVYLIRQQNSTVHMYKQVCAWKLHTDGCASRPTRAPLKCEFRSQILAHTSCQSTFSFPSCSTYFLSNSTLKCSRLHVFLLHLFSSIRNSTKQIFL